MGATKLIVTTKIIWEWNIASSVANISFLPECYVFHKYTILADRVPLPFLGRPQQQSWRLSHGFSSEVLTRNFPWPLLEAAPRARLEPRYWNWLRAAVLAPKHRDEMPPTLLTRLTLCRLNTVSESVWGWASHRSASSKYVQIKVAQTGLYKAKSGPTTRFCRFCAGDITL